MATKYRVEYRGRNREWIQMPGLYESMTTATLFALGNLGTNQVRIIQVDSLDTEKITAKEAFRKYG